MVSRFLVSSRSIMEVPHFLKVKVNILDICVSGPDPRQRIPFTHTNIRAGEFTEFKIAGNSGKNSVLITVSAIFQRKIGRNDNGFLPEQTFVQTGKEMGERHCRGSFGAEIVDNEQIAAVEIRTECGKLFPCPIVKRVPGE